MSSSFDFFYTGKTFGYAHGIDVTASIATIKYYAGWADKMGGQSMEVSFVGCEHEKYLNGNLAD